MTPGVLIGIGFLVLAGVLTWYLVQTLRQAQRTAAALEQFLQATRPGIEESAERLRTILGRADRVMASVEEGGESVRTAIRGLTAPFTGRTTAGRSRGDGESSWWLQLPTLVSTLVLGFSQVMNIFSGSPRRSAPVPSGGTSNE